SLRHRSGPSAGELRARRVHDEAQDHRHRSEQDLQPGERVPGTRIVPAAPLRALAALLAVASLFAGCRNRENAGRFPNAPVILISIDTLRADHLTAYGGRVVDTPAIDRLASDGILFENAYSHVPLTFPSHVSILNGQ